jgi:hypothetical protein
VALEKFWTERELEFLFESPDEGGDKKKKKVSTRAMISGIRSS